MNCKPVTILLVMLLILPAGLFCQQLDQLSHAKPFELSGNVSVTGIFYGAKGIPKRYLPFNYVVAGNPVLSIYGMQVPVSFIIGKQQNSFSQPFNQFGMSPTYKWVTIHAGYRNLSFSPYTLAGHTFLGGGLELNPGKFRFAAIYGQFNRATSLDTAQSMYFANFSYKRTGMSVRIGYGTEENHVDLIGLKAKDIPGSLKISKGLADSSGITPAENTVAGYALKLSFWHGRLSFESNGALSLYTSDVNAPGIQDSVYDNNIKTLDKIGTIRTSSEAYAAIDAAVRYKTKDFSVKVQYRHIDPGYQSMGAYFLNNDLESYTVAPAFLALKRKLRFSGSLGFQRDDLQSNKRARAHKVIGSANLSAEISQRLGVDLNYSNYSVNQSVKTIRFADSLKIVQSSSQFSFMPRYIIPGAVISQTIFLSANLSQARELNPARADSLNGDIDTYNYLLNYQINFVPQQASAYISLNHTQLKSQLLEDGNNGVTLGLSKNWLKNKVNLSASGGWLFSKRNDEKGRIITASLQGRYNFTGKHVFRITAYYTGNKPDHPTAIYPDYTEMRAEVSYGLSF